MTLRVGSPLFPGSLWAGKVSNLVRRSLNLLGAGEEAFQIAPGLPYPPSCTLRKADIRSQARLAASRL